MGKGKAIIAVVGFCAAMGSLFVQGGGFGFAPIAFGAVADWQKGGNIMPQSATDFAGSAFQQSLRNLAAVGANSVTLDIPLYQSTTSSTDVQGGWNTPTDATLASGITFAHSLGLHVILKIGLMSSDGSWSALINPADRATWFANYQSQVMHIAAIAQANGAEELCIGNELIDMSTDSANATNAGHWVSLIGAVRGAYTGRLTYGANWGDTGFPDEVDNISFWPSLDDVGISAYFNLSGDGSVASLMASWDSWNQNRIKPLAVRWGKPILFTEIGYKSIFDSYTHPWMWQESGNYDGAQQANDYQALFQYWNQFSYVRGAQFWFWSSTPGAGGAGDTDYTPQGKPAQAVIQQWFSAAAPSSSPPAANPVFSATASATPAGPAVGQATSFAATVKNSGGAVSGANVDMEIYNASGSRVFQQVFAGQTMTTNGSQQYTFTWTPSVAGAYVLKIGVFSGNWGQGYFWDDQALAFSVSSGAGSTSTGTPAASINIWWPSNGTTVTGVQPFKAMVSNMSVDSYAMFWQVDGGQLNLMQSNYTDYPHKESPVDVSPWTWRGTGPYAITFVAKNANGQVIAQSSVAITN